ncbi:WD40 repeat domain-containing protein [bacterium]|nr:WD40 repeat domain-containing protein [bacterium]
MHPRILCCIGAVAVLTAACSQTPNGQNASAVRISVPVTADRPAAAVQVRLVDDQSLGRALVAIARTASLTGEIPEVLYDPLLAALGAAGDGASLTVDAQGVVAVPRLLPRQVVVARTAHQLWVVSGTEVRDGRLQLNEANAGGQHALAVARARPNVIQALTVAAENALQEGQFHQARSLAHTIPSDQFVQRVDQAEIDALLAEAEAAFARQDYETARRLALRADAIDPQRETIDRLLERILIEQGGEQHQFAAHQGAVAAVAFTADGQYLVSAGADGVLRLGEAADGAEVRSWHSRRGPLTCLAIGPDGRWVVAGSASGALQIWDLDSGTELAATEGLGWTIRAVAVSPDGGSLLTAGDDGRVRFWQSLPLRETAVLSGHGWRVTSVAFSPDGQRAVSGSEDDTVRVWALSTAEQVGLLRHGSADVTCLAVSPDGRSLLTGGANRAMTLWNLVNSREQAVLPAVHQGPVRVVALTEGARYALSGGDDGTLQLWDLVARTGYRTYPAHEDGVRAVAVSPDGHRVATGGPNGAIKLWQLPRSVWPPDTVAAR